jgi:probable phosphoglycerate mutase
MTVDKHPRLALIRHAQTEWNRRKLIQGQQDSPLTDHGRAQADAWGHKLRGFGFTRILASDLGRAQETARRVNQSLDLPLDVEPRFREQDWGDWVGLRRDRLAIDHAETLAAISELGWDFRPPGGESRREVAARVREGLADAARLYGPGPILVVAHEGVLKFTIADLIGRRFTAGESDPLERYHLHWLTVEKDRVSLDRVNAVDLDA